MSALLAAALRVRAVELRLARARGASELLGKHIHALGNALQIIELSSLELTRDGSATSEPVVDLREANERAGEAFAAMLDLTKRAQRTTVGPPVGPAIRAAVAVVGPAIAAPIELRIELADGACSRLERDELDAIVAACVLDAVTATRLTLLVRERTIDDARWIELVRVVPQGSAELVVEPPSWLAVVDALARDVGGELSLSEGRDGSELVLAWPVAQSSSSS